MPTNQTPDDAELSRLLNQAEPPRSPAHVDEAILQYARENVPVTEKESTWFHRPWATAVATLSIAAIAVSVSINSFNSGDLERSVSESSLVQLEASDVPLAQSAELNDGQFTEEARTNSPTDLSRERQVAQNSVSLTTLSAESDVAAAGAATVETVVEVDTNDNAVSGDDLPAEEEIATAFSQVAPTALSQDQAEESVDDNVGRLENAVADTSAAITQSVQSGLASANPQPAARRSANTAVRSQAQLSELLELVAVDIDPLDLLPIVENLLNQVEVDVDTRIDTDQAISSSELASQLLQRFNGIEDEEMLLQLEERFAEFKVGFTDFELPDTFAAAMDEIQQLSN